MQKFMIVSVSLFALCSIAKFVGSECSDVGDCRPDEVCSAGNCEKKPQSPPQTQQEVRAQQQQPVGGEDFEFVGPPLPEPELPKWSYHAATDQMTDKIRHFATVDSQNSFEFGFPYNRPDGTFGHLTVRSKPKGPPDVMFQIDAGQLLCHSYDPCTITVRFDDDKPVRFRGTGPADHSTEMAFLSNEKKFVTRLAKAKTLQLQIEIYQEGTRTFSFDVDGFDAIAKSF